MGFVRQEILARTMIPPLLRARFEKHFGARLLVDSIEEKAFLVSTYRISPCLRGK